MEQVINEQKVMSKIFWRLTPLMVFLYIVSYLDRVNVGFAALTMNKDIGLSPYMYGLGAGIFFWGYFIFEIPSNLIMAKVGARIWIARILFTWGLVAIAMAWVQGPRSFLMHAIHPWHCRGGVFPWGDSLLDLLVSGALPGANYFLLHVGDSAFVWHRGADFDRDHAFDERSPRP